MMPVEILEGYRVRSGGTVSVLGVDPGRPTRAWRSLDAPAGMQPGDLVVERGREHRGQEGVAVRQ